MSAGKRPSLSSAECRPYLLRNNFVERASVPVLLALCFALAPASAKSAMAAVPSFSVVHAGGVTSPSVQLSADGSTVVFQVGGYQQGNYYRWTRDAGATIVADAESTSVAGISGDGSVLVGSLITTTGTKTAARWTAATGWQSLGLGDGSLANHISSDGSTIVGTIPILVPGHHVPQGFRWSESGGMTLLAPGILSMPSSVSADGSAVTGIISSEEGSRTFRWTPDGGMQTVMPSTRWDRMPYPHPIISGDGRVIVRWAAPLETDLHSAAFRWSESTGIVELQKLEGWVEAHPHALTQDGSLVVGDLARSFGAGASLGVVWDSTGAIESAADYLTARGVEVPPTWTHLFVTGISHDGSTLAGSGGDSATGQRTVWIATVPEPTLGILALLAVPLMRRRRHQPR